VLPYDRSSLLDAEIWFRLPAWWPGGFATIGLAYKAPAASRLLPVLLLEFMPVNPALIYRPGLVSVLPRRLTLFNIVLLEPKPTTVSVEFLSGLSASETI
jgi:hypothetical protein